MFIKFGPVCGGADIGKKRSPSHISIFEGRDNILVQIHQKFLDSWDYTKQVQYFKEAIDFFHIDYLYYDNTRGEMEERDLPKRICVPIIFTESSKRKMANSFSKLVESNKIKLLDDDRFLKQILVVTNDLHAPDTPLGHGDSFFSIMLAIAAYEDHYGSLARDSSKVLDLQNFVATKEGQKKKTEVKEGFILSKKFEIKNKCPFCNKTGFLIKKGDKMYCEACFTNF